ncbi:GPW/gp25 family protein [Chitinophaga cymbidii]|uniref:Baseplate protein n=1 Tax=Chitinophaga cymbidii TaxID=1096750 RepID=A0A512RJZ9_9BACT|nr:GPW/gp25 family protein [Chitinophaga cymbidii]GEP96029.1 baseplate protein [Chitinophaga cymbidii]
MANEKAFLGKGWSFPPVFDKFEKEVVMLEAEESVRSSISLLLSTELGERVMQPAFGWKRDRWLFESLSTSSATAIEKEIETALLMYEPRVNLNEVRVLPDAMESGKISIRVDYTVRSTNKRNNLVFPFYLTEK